MTVIQVELFILVVLGTNRTEVIKGNSSVCEDLGKQGANYRRRVLLLVFEYPPGNFADSAKVGTVEKAKSLRDLL